MNVQGRVTLGLARADDGGRALALYRVLDDPPFNHYIHTAPCDRKESRYHWHLEITPRLTETAGFERGTGFYIRPVMPEDAAQILREGGRAPS